MRQKLFTQTGLAYAFATLGLDGIEPLKRAMSFWDAVVELLAHCLVMSWHAPDTGGRLRKSTLSRVTLFNSADLFCTADPRIGTAVWLVWQDWMPEDPASYLEGPSAKSTKSKTSRAPAL